MPKTKDGYEVVNNDLVWCVSDPFTIVSIANIYEFFAVGEKEIRFTFWVDPGDGEGCYPVDSHEVFLYQKNCLIAARHIAYENIQCNEASIQIYTEEIDSINKFLKGLE